MSIENQLGLKFPIYWNESSAEEKFVKYLISKVISYRPINVIELGSGLSTLIILKTLEKLNYDYNFVSVDSDELFLNETKNMLISEGVYNEKRVKLIHSPITSISLNGHDFKWYNPDDLKFDYDRVDILFIDGPLGVLCKNSRYPAIPILRKYLKKDSVVLLHDAKRKDETEIVDIWRKENADITRAYKIETERGGAELHFDVAKGDI